LQKVEITKTSVFKKKNEEQGPTLIYQHLGLGDYIIISGGLKYLKRNGLLDRAFCICKHEYLPSITQLYSDVEGLEVISVNDWKGAEILVDQWKGKKLIIGFENMSDWYHFDMDFYRILGVDFTERWNSFTIDRNPEAENKLLREVCPAGDFVFVHDDMSRGLQISEKHINSSLPVVRPFVTNSIFDWVSVLEKATEIHCMCSSFKHLVDSLPGINADLYYHHSYVKNGTVREHSISSSRYGWKII
jgi:hypothetical protein